MNMGEYGYNKIWIRYNREFVQKPHEPHAAFVHCAKPRDKMKNLCYPGDESCMVPHAALHNAQKPHAAHISGYGHTSGARVQPSLITDASSASKSAPLFGSIIHPCDENFKNFSITCGRINGPVARPEDLEALLTAIKNLPAAAQSRRRHDPAGKYLTPGLTKGDNPEPTFPSHKDGPYAVFNEQWECVFQLQRQPGDPDNKLEKLVSHGRGKHGLILAHAWATHYATVVKLDEEILIQLRVKTLLNLITKSIFVFISYFGQHYSSPSLSVFYTLKSVKECTKHLIVLNMFCGWFWNP
ncbi:hypothetical protein DFH08DRAFT_821949 [Mycena albidolilacea]|uniref:Uncharacterized protein n=1 Tax=Mycena albidolilacea TaxID=1033008 RepID=A0AAD6Z9G4_9AGAR|nr:hypothetical protein DFH08DRAFT_821949 [Mycena albidolilacea]